VLGFGTEILGGVGGKAITGGGLSTTMIGDSSSCGGSCILFDVRNVVVDTSLSDGIQPFIPVRMVDIVFEMKMIRHVSLQDFLTLVKIFYNLNCMVILMLVYY